MNVAVHQLQDWLTANLETRATLDDLALGPSGRYEHPQLIPNVSKRDGDLHS